MKLIKKAAIAVSYIGVLSFGALAQNDLKTEISNTTKTALIEYDHSSPVYPPVFFVSNVENELFLDKFNKYQAFETLDKEAVGLPIGVRVLKGHKTKQDSTQFSSMMLSASTLGLIPLVSNTEFKVRYDVFVQGKSIAHFEYSMDSKDINNMWTAAYKDHKTKPSEILFLQDTLPKFLTELKGDPKVQAAFSEYREYFN
ncbi:hypothetical protein J8L98_21035 [Pseudoalteromonas sp. MMG013]|uniref:hypothetical protein n=1 Tax=Pseudoalteromonas sp. MMG013 TaxID=2822687 RepID=UPI001B36FAD0|nr:hypothetical protein [Pseudoalteromonas sp. MMG013]MBQ4864179.1 hypothetical protein [Pseudoalteromonas sp. MMG013]